uniref:Uncharacterized protein n=1 Tax=Toxoplasma gondii COUG TaxID=1074873 RepID=A0A2G8YAF7_TOXGO|nr:hypothetical protein TGCOUG_273985 [Toxoplasma gondii COUG]
MCRLRWRINGASIWRPRNRSTGVDAHSTRHLKTGTNSCEYRRDGSHLCTEVRDAVFDGKLCVHTCSVQSWKLARAMRADSGRSRDGLSAGERHSVAALGSERVRRLWKYGEDLESGKRPRNSARLHSCWKYRQFPNSPLFGSCLRSHRAG